MFRTDQNTAVTSLPVPAPAGTPGFFTGGNPATGQAATILDADWLNMVQEELMSVLAAASITPSKTTYTQIVAAIRALIASSVGVIKGIARFTSSTSFTVPAGVTTVYASGCAAGGAAGSGGAGSVSSTSAWSAGGGGGGAGQSMIRVPYTVVPGSVISITIPAAATGGAAPTSGNGNNGASGGNLVISGTASMGARR